MEKNTLQSVSSNESQNDWAILPFDEEEDTKRWEILIEEMTELEKGVEDLKAAGVDLSLESKFDQLKTPVSQNTDAFVDEDLF